MWKLDRMTHSLYIRHFAIWLPIILSLSLFSSLMLPLPTALGIHNDNQSTCSPVIEEIQLGTTDTPDNNSTSPPLGVFSLDEFIMNTATNQSSFLMLGITGNTTIAGVESAEPRLVYILAESSYSISSEPIIMANVTSYAISSTYNETDKVLDMEQYDQRNASISFPLRGIAGYTAVVNDPSLEVRSNIIPIMTELVRRIVHVDCELGGVMAITISDVNISEILLTKVTESVSVGGQPIDLEVESSSTIDQFQFDEQAKQITFTISGVEGTEGVTMITIGRVLQGPYSVVIGEGSISYFDVFEDPSSNEVTIKLVYAHSSEAHDTTITGAQVVPEFPVTIIIMAAAIASVIMLSTLVSKRKGSGFSAMGWSHK